MPERRENLTYKEGMSRQETYRALIAVGAPLGVLGLGLFTISNFATFGTRLICPLSGVMWAFGFLVALVMPSMRQEVLRQTLLALVAYYAVMIFFKAMIAMSAGVSTDMIAASFNQSVPIATGNAFSGYLPTMMWAVALLWPIGFLGMEGRRVLQFKKNQTLQKTFGQKRGMRGAGKETFRTH